MLAPAVPPAASPALPIAVASALLGAEIAGTDAAAGLPLGLLVVGQAAAAVLVSRRTFRIGRGRSLALGYVLGAAGAAMVVLAAAGSLSLFLAGSVVLGAGNTSVFMTRYNQLGY